MHYVLWLLPIYILQCNALHAHGHERQQFLNDRGCLSIYIMYIVYNVVMCTYINMTYQCMYNVHFTYICTLYILYICMYNIHTGIYIVHIYMYHIWCLTYLVPTIIYDEKYYILNETN